MSLRYPQVLRRSSRSVDFDGIPDHRELFKSDIVILIVGRQETKTNFITKAKEDIDVQRDGDDLYRRIVRGLRVILRESKSVTSDASDSEATAMLYLHNINDYIPEHWPEIEMFNEKVGYFVTTLSSNLDFDREKERQLLSSFRITAKTQPIAVRRFLNTKESAWDILDSIILHELCTRLELDQVKLEIFSATFSNKTRLVEFDKMVDEKKRIIQIMIKSREWTHKSEKIRDLFKQLDDFCSRFGQLSPTVVTIDELCDYDVVIVVMGPTGSGKSNFISTVADRLDNVGITVGHNLQSCTSVVSAVKIKHPIVSDVKIALVDTPGFDDTHESDVEILKRISNWLKKAYKSKKSINGILYFHRINDNRMSGTALKNLGMFKKLCGDDGFKKVTFVTTMWPQSPNEMKGYEVDEMQALEKFWEECEDREKQLKEQFWKVMIHNGASTERFFNNPQSAWSILNPFVEKHLQDGIATFQKITPMLIQKELVHDGELLASTSAGKELHMNIEELVKKQAVLLERMKLEVGRTSNPEVMKALVQEYAEIAKKRKEAVSQMRKLEPLMNLNVKRMFGNLNLRFWN